MSLRQLTILSSPAFSPKNIAGLQLWLDAQVAGSITQAATLVSAWADQSGNSNNVTAAGALRPTYNATGINSLPTLDTVGAQGMAFTTAVTGNILTMFYVVRFGALSSQGMVGGSDGTMILYNGSFGVSIFGSGGEADNNTTLSTATNYVISAIANTDYTATTAYVNGSALSQTSHSAGVFNFTANRIMCRNNASSNMTGSTGECLIYNTALTTPQHSQVISYLRAKWGI